MTHVSPTVWLVILVALALAFTVGVLFGAALVIASYDDDERQTLEPVVELPSGATFACQCSSCQRRRAAALC